MYINEIQKPFPQRNQEVIKSYMSLQEALKDTRVQLDNIEKEIKTLDERKSPYMSAEVKIPEFGIVDIPNADQLKMIPVVKSDDDISIKDLFELICSVGKRMGLSEEGYKYAITSRLKGKRAKAWISYQKLPLRQAITSLIALFDRQDSSIKYALKIKNFAMHKSEDLLNSIQRLLKYVDKCHPTKSEEVLKVLRTETLMLKLDKLLSSRAQREVFRLSEKKLQGGEDISEKELIDNIYTEHMFDQRAGSERSYLEVHSIQPNSQGYDSDNNYHHLSDDDSNSDFEINAIESKRSADDAKFENSDRKQARLDDGQRRMLTARRSTPHDNRPNATINDTVNSSVNKPRFIGNSDAPHIRINNPNPNNRWSNRPRPQSGRFQSNDRTLPNNVPRQSFRELLHSRNAPLQQQQQNRNDNGRFNGRFENGRFGSRNQSFGNNFEREKPQWNDFNLRFGRPQNTYSGPSSARQRVSSWPGQRSNSWSNQRPSPYSRPDYRSSNFTPLGSSRGQSFNSRSPYDRFRQNQQSQFNPNRSGVNPDGSYRTRFNNGLRQNLSVRTNPPEIYQQISMGKPSVNSLCMKCPREEKAHAEADCPRAGQVFRNNNRLNSWR